MDLFVVKVEDVYRFKESDLFGFLDGQGYIDGSMEPHEDCQWVIVNFTNRIFDLGYPEALKDVHCVGNCILEKQDFYDIYNIFSKYDGLPPMTYDIDKAYWAIQYGTCVEVLEPLSLRNKIVEAVEDMSHKDSVK